MRDPTPEEFRLYHQFIALLILGIGSLFVVKNRALIKREFIRGRELVQTYLPEFVEAVKPVNVVEEAAAKRIQSKAIEAAAMGQDLVYHFTDSVSPELGKLFKDPWVARDAGNALMVPGGESLINALGVPNLQAVYAYLVKFSKQGMENGPLYDLMKRIEAEFDEAGIALGFSVKGKSYEDRIWDAEQTAKQLDPGAKMVHVIDLLKTRNEGRVVYADIPSSQIGALVFSGGKWVNRYAGYKPSEPFTAIDKLREAGADLGWLSYNWGEKVE